MSDLDARTISAMQVGEPVATYKKVTLGKVCVTVLNSFSGRSEGLILKGQPGEETEMVDVWSDKEDTFFQRMNAELMKRGVVIKVSRQKDSGPKPIEQYTDDELRDVINLQILQFRKLLSEIKSPTVVSRMLAIARAEEKSEKFINGLLAKLSELQSSQ